MAINYEMLVFGFFLIPIVLVSSIELPRSYYVPKIQGPALIRIEIIGEKPDTLDLSGLGFGRIDSDVFDNLTHVKSINLANNHIGLNFLESPYRGFSRLEKLENLSLVNNGIGDLSYGQFTSLRNLKFLNISNNPLSSFHGGRFYGLGKSTNISAKVTDGIELLHTLAFEDYNDPADRSFPVYPTGKWRYFEPVDPAILCKKDGIVEELKPHKIELYMNPHCEILRFGFGFRPAEVRIRNLTLNELGISKFTAGWYRLNTTSFRGITFDHNNIVDLSSEILNDLPAHVINIDLSNNKITALKNETILNEHIKYLSLADNAISEIQDGALERSRNLSSLDLSQNRLNNTRFLGTLSQNLQSLSLRGNRISEILSNIFSRFSKLEKIDFADNNITIIKNVSLRGLISANSLILARNKIEKIETGSFQDLRSLRYLDLSNNKLTDLEKGVFDGLEVVDYIDLSSNNIKKITHDSFQGLTDTLQTLFLSFNEIEILENGTFIKIPTQSLSLNDNKIRKVENGTFNLETLKSLNLKNNLLSQINGDEFASLDKLEILDLSRNTIPKIGKGFLKYLSNVIELNLSNNTIEVLEIDALQSRSLESLYLQNNLLSQVNGDEFAGIDNLKLLDLSNNGIPKIEKGFAKHLGKVTELRLGYNPIEKLENGALFGLTKANHSIVRLDGIRLELLQGGVFDDL